MEVIVTQFSSFLFLPHKLTWKKWFAYILLIALVCYLHFFTYLRRHKALLKYCGRNV